MGSKIYDKFLLFATLVAMSPLIIAALIAVGIGYPVHRIKNFIFKKDDRLRKV